MFALTKSKHEEYIGPVPDSPFVQQWKHFRLLYPVTKFHSELQNIEEDDETAADDDGFVCDIALSKDTKKMMAGSSSGDIYMLNPHSEKLLAKIKGPCPVTKVTFVGDTEFVSASADGNISLWDCRNLRETQNVLKGHKNIVRSLDYSEDSCKLISSSYDCDVCSWHIPSCKTRSGEDGTTSSREILFKCPDINQLAINWHYHKLLCITSKGTIFMVDNLDVDNLKEDLKYFKFDENLPLMMSWIKPNASDLRRNAVRIINSADYNPRPHSTVSKIHHIQTHPNLPLALLRFTASQQTLYSGSIVSDWTVIYDINRLLVSSNLTAMDNMVTGYGADITEDSLLYAQEETRYCTHIDKKASFSLCGRVIASPDKDGIRLLAFSDKLDLPITTKRTSFEDIFGQSTGPSPLRVVAQLSRNEPVLCTRFCSQTLVAGEMRNRISFYLPRT